MSDDLTPRAAAKAREEAAAQDAEAAKRDAAAKEAVAAKERFDRLAAADAAAKAATAAQERVRAAQDALEKERAVALALEREAVAARKLVDPIPLDGDDLRSHAGYDDHAFYEAATIANLHAEAAGVQNIKALVPLVLDPLSTHFNRWRDLVLLTLERYTFSYHVLSDDVHPNVPAWHLMDAVVLSWIFGTVTTELMETVRVRGGTAPAARLAIEEQFLGNRETRTLHLDAEFRVFVQGDLSVRDYCRKMRGMADALGDLGESSTT
ncbi:hypothetical protein ACP70R_031934 [Stipagrostis hirtigluma subsp. patula]